MKSSPPRPLSAGTLLILLLLATVSVEAGVRRGFSPPGNIKQLVSNYTQDTQTNPDILLFGSCLPEQMLDLQDLGQALKPTYDLEHLATATGTGLLWHVLLNSHIGSEKKTAAILIPYGGTDLTRRNMPWESQLMEISTLKDVPDLMALDCQTFSCRAQILVRSLSRAYRYRAYIAQQLWTRLGTGSLEKASRDAQFFQSWNEVRPKSADPHLYLKRFLQLAKEKDIPLIFTPLPARDDITTDKHRAQMRRRQQETNKAVILEGGGYWRPFPGVPGLNESHFEDDVHVNREGRLLLTKSLSKALPQWMAAIQKEQN